MYILIYVYIFVYNITAVVSVKLFMVGETNSMLGYHLPFHERRPLKSAGGLGAWSPRRSRAAPW